MIRNANCLHTNGNTLHYLQFWYLQGTCYVIIMPQKRLERWSDHHTFAVIKFYEFNTKLTYITGRKLLNFVQFPKLISPVTFSSQYLHFREFYHLLCGKTGVHVKTLSCIQDYHTEVSLARMARTWQELGNVMPEIKCVPQEIENETISSHPSGINHWQSVILNHLQVVSATCVTASMTSFCRLNSKNTNKMANYSNLNFHVETKGSQTNANKHKIQTMLSGK